MRRFSLFFGILICSSFFAQKETYGIDFSEKSNNIMHNYLQNKLEFFGVGKIENLKSNNIIRFWSITNCVQIDYTDKSKNSKVFFAIQNTEDKNEFLRKEVELSLEQSEKIFELVKRNNLEELPTDEKIIGWTKGFDGFLFDIESNIENSYEFKSFWSPDIQNVPESKKIIKLIEELNKIVDIQTLFKNFISENKFTCYRYYGTAYSVCNILTKKEARKLKRLKKRNNNYR